MRDSSRGDETVRAQRARIGIVDAGMAPAHVHDPAEAASVPEAAGDVGRRVHEALIVLSGQGPSGLGSNATRRIAPCVS
jgi:hypothetical protein